MRIRRLKFGKAPVGWCALPEMVTEDVGARTMARTDRIEWMFAAMVVIGLAMLAAAIWTW
jgi:hypothetical protein